MKEAHQTLLLHLTDWDKFGTAPSDDRPPSCKANREEERLKLQTSLLDEILKVWPFGCVQSPLPRIILITNTDLGWFEAWNWGKTDCGIHCYRGSSTEAEIANTFLPYPQWAIPKFQRLGQTDTTTQPMPSLSILLLNIHGAAKLSLGWHEMRINIIQGNWWQHMWHLNPALRNGECNKVEVCQRGTIRTYL